MDLVFDDPKVRRVILSFAYRKLRTHIRGNTEANAQNSSKRVFDDEIH